MTDSPDDEDDKKTGGETESEGKGRSDGSSGTGTAGGVTFSDADRGPGEEERITKRKRTEGDGESGTAAAGTGYVRASGEGVIRLSTEKQKAVWEHFRHLDFNDVVAAMAEFFNDFPQRASANLTVAWNNGAKNGYALVNRVIKFGQDVATAVRERTRESAVQVRRRYGVNVKFKTRGTMAPPIPNPQAGMT